MKWMPVIGYEGLYEVSEKGDIRSLPRMRRAPRGGVRKYGGKTLKPSFVGGYAVVTLYDGQRSSWERIHLLVLSAFKGPRPEGLIARHLDGIRTHNDVSNLEWGTHKENSEDAMRHGTTQRGEKSHTAKLTWTQAAEIRESKELLRVLAERFGVSTSLISAIRCRHIWKPEHAPAS